MHRVDAIGDEGAFAPAQDLLADAQAGGHVAEHRLEVEVGVKELGALGLPLGVEVARHLKARIREETQLTASAGVAPNKFIAKIASGWKKPEGLTVIAPERVERFLKELPV